MAVKCLKKCSKSLVITEMQVNRTVRFHFYQPEWLRSKSQVKTHVGEDVEKEEHSSIANGIGGLHWLDHSGNESVGSSENCK